MKPSVLDLGHRSARNPCLAGGKGAGLARLRSLGFDVPPGFIITAPRFCEVLTHLEISFNKESRSGVVSGELPAALQLQVLARAHKLKGKLAVRSSLVGEDSVQASMAGQLTTILDVDGEDALLAAVKKCYASALAPQLATYRSHMDGLTDRRATLDRDPAVEQHLAVIVQEMQPSSVAGVAFSADPVTGQRCVLIEAAAGPPDSVVSGRVDPTRWRVNARGVLVDRIDETTHLDLLPDAAVLELAAAVRRIAGRFEFPVDVEWAWDGRRFWYLQARPVTTLIGKHVYSNRLVADMSPGLIKPLLWSTNTLSMTRNVFGRIFDELLGPTGLDYQLLARRFYSRLYTDMTLLGDLLVRVGLPANFFEVMARDERGEIPRPKFTFSQLLGLRRLLPFAWRNLRAEASIRDFLARQRTDLARYRRSDWRETSTSELLVQVRNLQVLHGRSQWFIFLAAINSMIRKKSLERMVRRHVPRVDPSTLIRRVAGLKALEPNRHLRKLALIAAELPAGQLETLAKGDHAEIRYLLDSSRTGRKLLTGFADYMEKYGFLSANGTDISGESWVEKPGRVWQIIARGPQQLQVDPDPAKAVINQEARARIRDHLSFPKRRVFDRLLQSTATYLDLRDRVSMLLSEDAFEMRRGILAIADKLCASRKLAVPDDIFYLYFNELECLVGGGLPATEARTLIDQRRTEMVRDEQFHPEETICGENPAPCLPQPANAGCCLMGIAGSAGVVEGRVRIVRDPLDAPSDLGPQDILVVPFTDVGWTPLFAGIAGIVAEAGGQLSHTAIVAREYSLPAVVSVAGATRLLREHQPITLDGGSGRVFTGHVLERREMIG